MRPRSDAFPTLLILLLGLPREAQCLFEFAHDFFQRRSGGLPLFFGFYAHDTQNAALSV